MMTRPGSLGQGEATAAGARSNAGVAAPRWRRLDPRVLRALAVVVDVVHAALLCAWVVPIPLLFWHRWPRLTRAFAVYAVGFVVVYQISDLALDECFLTRLARWLYGQGGGEHAPPSEWLSVRLAYAVFRMSPSHHAVVVAGQVLMIVTAVGVLVSMRAHRRRERGG